MTDPDPAGPVHWRRATVFLGLAIGAGFAIRVLLTWLSLEHLPVVSDEAEIGLQAMRIADGARPLFVYGLSYLFPLDAYLLSLAIEHLPRNAASVRLPYLAAGMLSAIGFLCLVRVALPPGSRWPAALLVAIPSTYWMLIQSAYTPPQYAYTTLVVLAVIVIAVRAARGTDTPGWTLLAGLLTGFALSLQPVFVTMLAATGLVIVFHGTLGRVIARMALMGTGMVAGMTPMILGKIRHPESFTTVTSLRDAGTAASMWTDYVLTTTLPRAMGIDPTVFPDFPYYLDLPGSLRIAFLALYCLILGTAIVLRLAAVVQALRRRRRPSFEPVDIFLIATLLAIGVFPFSSRAGEFQFRYLLPAVWSLPFIVGYLHLRLGPGVLRSGAVVTTVTLASLNAVTALAVAEHWNRPGFIANRADTWPIDGLIATLDELGIDRCHAELWLAHRIPYRTDDRIVCTQPYNKRHPHWPLPDKEIIDRSERVAYVLTDTITSHLGAARFRVDLHHNDVEYERLDLAPFRIFHRFRHAPTDGTCLLPATGYGVRTEPVDSGATSLHDGSTRTYWTSGTSQREDMALRIELGSSRNVRHLILYYRPVDATPAPELAIDGHSDGRWRPLSARVPPRPNRFLMINRHPVYGHVARQIFLDADDVDAIRVRIARADAGSPWTLGEVQVGVTCDPGTTPLTAASGRYQPSTPDMSGRVWATPL
jgi:hypothetical protein